MLWVLDVVGTQKNRFNEKVVLSIKKNIIMLKLMGKKIFTILCSKSCLSKPVYIMIIMDKILL